MDDGSGIKEVDFDIIAKRGTTSKIREFDDIYSIKSLGFRGEALSSLCNIANVTISTKQASLDTGWEIKFDHMGNVFEKRKISRKVRLIDAVLIVE
jgi:DNA mismatch repair protein PMS2